MAESFAEFFGNPEAEALTEFERELGEARTEAALDVLAEQQRRREAIAQRYGLNETAAAQLTGITEREMREHAAKLQQDRRNLARYSPNASTATAFAEYIENQLASKHKPIL